MLSGFADIVFGEKMRVSKLFPAALKRRSCLAFSDGVLAKTGRAFTHECVCSVRRRHGCFIEVSDRAVMKITPSVALGWRCVYGQTGVHSIAVPLL